jgi:hypothetical protein
MVCDTKDAAQLPVESIIAAVTWTGEIATEWTGAAIPTSDAPAGNAEPKW